MLIRRLRHWILLDLFFPLSHGIEPVSCDLTYGALTTELWTHRSKFGEIVMAYFGIYLIVRQLTLISSTPCPVLDRVLSQTRADQWVLCSTMTLYEGIMCHIYLIAARGPNASMMTNKFKQCTTINYL